MRTDVDVARRLGKARHEAGQARRRFDLLRHRPEGNPAELVDALYLCAQHDAVVRALSWVLEIDAGLPRVG